MARPSRDVAQNLLDLALRTQLLTVSQAEKALAALEAGAPPAEMTRVLVEEGCLSSDQADQLSSLVPEAHSPRIEVLNAPAPQEWTPPDISGTRFGEFQIVRELGRGGMGVVYEAMQSPLDRRVALKVLPAARQQDPLVLARFLREARATSKLRHPNIVRVYDTGSVGDLHYIAMEFVKGSSLGDLLRADRFPPRRAAAIALATAEALSCAHAAGVVHRDVNPSNILVNEDGNPLLMDFGLARDANEAAVTGTGMVLGTAAYMSPEQARGERADEQADVYGLGATLYELLTGRRPFPGTTWMDLIRQVLLEDPAPVRSIAPDVPEALERITIRAMEKDKQARYLSMAALRNDLAQWLELPPPSTPAAG